MRAQERRADAPARAAARQRSRCAARGLLLGLEIDRVATDAIADCLERGVLVGSAGERVLRITPPLTITDDELAHALDVLEEVLA